MSDLFKVMFDDLFNNQAANTPLQKEGDTVFELDYWTEELNTQNKKVLLSEFTKNGENILIYITPIEEVDDHIVLRSLIFSKEGVRSLTPSMFLLFKRKYELLEIADIRMQDSDANKGYGSSLIKAMFLLLEHFKYPIKYITGWISTVDWHHVQRNQHFYQKFGFIVELNEAEKEGTILWINPSNSGSIDHYRRLSYKPGIEGLMKELHEESKEE